MLQKWKEFICRHKFQLVHTVEKDDITITTYFCDKCGKVVQIYS